MAIKLKIGKLRGVEVNLISSLLIILNAQNINPIITKASRVNSLAGVKGLSHRRWMAMGTNTAKAMMLISMALE